jgi:hypothetical protein
VLLLPSNRPIEPFEVSATGSDSKPGSESSTPPYGIRVTIPWPSRIVLAVARSAVAAKRSAPRDEPTRHASNPPKTQTALLGAYIPSVLRRIIGILIFKYRGRLQKPPEPVSDAQLICSMEAKPKCA